MLTDDKRISTPEYWNEIYTGKRNDKPVDGSNFKRPANAFDRFQWLADQVEGPKVLDVASGHATSMKRLRAMHPEWDILCSDQTIEALKAANFKPYVVVDAYQIGNKYSQSRFDSITVSQALEYFEHPDTFMKQVRKLADYFICTIPEGEMKQWTQLRIYTEENAKEFFSKYGEIVHFDKVPGLMLIKVKLYV